MIGQQFQELLERRIRIKKEIIRGKAIVDGDFYLVELLDDRNYFDLEDMQAGLKAEGYELEIERGPNDLQLINGEFTADLSGLKVRLKKTVYEA